MERAMQTSTSTRVGPRDSGFTMIELVVAMLVFGTLAMAVIGIIMNAQSQSLANRDRIAAAGLASREVDIAREAFAVTGGPAALVAAGTVTNANPLPGGAAGQPLVIDGTPYTVKRRAHWDLAVAGASACDGGALLRYPSLTLTATVTWPGMTSTKPVIASAKLSPAKRDGVTTTDSFIAVKVTDKANVARVGVPVKAQAGGVVKIGTTDDSGCAVLQVSPAATGTNYDVSVNDPTFIDITGTPSPSRSTGLIQQSQLYHDISFAVEHPGTVIVTLERTDGVTLTNADVNGKTLSLAASESAGGSSVVERVVTATVTTFSGLWPSNYGAYFGTVPPVDGYPSVELGPGETVTIVTPFQMAVLPIDNLPSGTTQVVAFPAGTVPNPTCTGPVAPTTAGASGDSATLTALPGVYDLYVSGAAFRCSPGPRSVSAGSGSNTPLDWADTFLRLNSAPTGTLWAIEKNRSGLASLTGCPSTLTGTPVDVTGSKNVDTFKLAAGAWYIWATSGSTWNSPCSSYPSAISPAGVVYDQVNPFTWSSRTATLTVTNVTSTNRYIVVTTVAPTCNRTAITPTPTVPEQGPSSSTLKQFSFSVPVPASTTDTLRYLVYEWDKTSSNNCVAKGYFNVKSTTTSLTKLNDTSVVGP
jgi:prepilin-type N-terminal cleavage/methylation domain-containing protein